MTLRTFRIVLGVSAILIFLAVFLAFLAAPYLGSVYLTLVIPSGNDFSRLTSEFALPMLRVEPGAQSHLLVNVGWSMVVWGITMVTPVLVAVWSFTASNLTDCRTRWCAGLMLYVPVVVCLGVAVVSGLLVSIAHMG